MSCRHRSTKRGLIILKCFMLQALKVYNHCAEQSDPVCSPGNKWRSGVPKKLFKVGVKRQQNHLPSRKSLLLQRANQTANGEHHRATGLLQCWASAHSSIKATYMSQTLAIWYHKKLSAVSNTGHKVCRTSDTSCENLQDLLSELTWCLISPLHGLLQKRKPSAHLHGFFLMQ